MFTSVEYNARPTRSMVLLTCYETAELPAGGRGWRRNFQRSIYVCISTHRASHSSTILPSDNMSRSRTPPPQACSPNIPDRPPSSPQNNRITIKNRRKKYLDTHPAYFLSPSLELAGLFAFSHHLCLRTAWNSS